MNQKQAIEILALNDFPTLDEIKSAYRKLALTYHPDRNPEAKATVIFRQATEAYNYLVEHIEEWVLKEPTVIKKDSPSVDKEDTSITNVENIFDDIFGFTRQNRVLGFEESQSLPINLHDLYFGGSIKAKLFAYARCKTCLGSGCEEGTLAAICTYCFGAGTIKTKNETRKKCTVCEGRGRKIKHPCHDCRGFGRIKKYGWQDIHLPMGLKSGESFTLETVLASDKKEKLNIFVIPSLQSHDFFRVEKSDLICEYPVTKRELDVEKKFVFPFLTGEQVIQVGEKSKEGSNLVIVGKGLALDPSGKNRGAIRIVPLVLSEDEVKLRRKKIVRVMARDFSVYRNKLGLFEKLKMFLSL